MKPENIVPLTGDEDAFLQLVWPVNVDEIQ